MTVIDAAAVPPPAGEVTLTEPLLGFPDHTRFALTGVGDDGDPVVFTLRSATDPGLRFILADAGRFHPDLAVDADAEVRRALGVDAGEPLSVLLVVTAARSLETATVNLMAPLVVAHRARKAVQVLLADSGLPIAAPLLAPAGSA